MKIFNIFYDKTFFKFIITGIINTFVGAGIMFAFYNLFHCSYWLSSIMNYVIGSIVSFLLNKYWTFKSNLFSIKEVIYFIINIAVCFIIAYGAAKPFAMYLLSDYSVKVQENVAMFIGMVIFTLLNYLSQRFIVFKKA
ncbi:MAG TPA: GtrA family protein [Candidatus Mucispirillum faecigallinarum]|uniref:GtrA family protein n=1 Tax=Candidatus Mucispirillum faecigallinarum TaxID=2838699 RepID=A0A9D2KAU7_9BACT|nr:GtrA family protein [Candidatus Mucispirillum faecigallinarum]